MKGQYQNKVSMPYPALQSASLSSETRRGARATSDSEAAVVSTAKSLVRVHVMVFNCTSDSIMTT